MHHIVCGLSLAKDKLYICSTVRRKTVSRYPQVTMILLTKIDHDS